MVHGRRLEEPLRADGHVARDTGAAGVRAGEGEAALDLAGNARVATPLR